MTHLPVGAALKALREQLGLSQRELAKKSGLTQQRISQLESGNKCPTLKTLFRVVRSTGIPAYRVVREVERVVYGNIKPVVR